MPSARRNRRSDLQSRRGPRKGLSSVMVSLRRTDENASALQTRRSLCTRKKQARRSVIIATGYGGINGYTNYRRQKSCRD